MDMRGNPTKKGGIRACLRELKMGVGFAQGLSYEVAALVVVFIKKRGASGGGCLEKWNTPTLGLKAVHARWGRS